MQSAARTIPCAAEGERHLSPAAQLPPPTRIVDPANAVSLPGVGLDLPEAEKIALRQALKLAPGQSLIERNLASVLLDDHQAVEAAAFDRRSPIRQPRVPAGPIDERDEGS